MLAARITKQSCWEVAAYLELRAARVEGGEVVRGRQGCALSEEERNRGSWAKKMMGGCWMCIQRPD